MVFSLTTERLDLTDMTSGDLPDIRLIAGDRDVMRYVLIWLEDEKQVVAFLDHAIDEARRKDRVNYRLAVRIRDTDAFAGMALLEIDPVLRTTAEVGCILLPAYWNAGYASEILESLLAFGFGALALHRVYGKCDALNRASAHVLEKGGLTYEGTHREDVWLRDHWRSTDYYGILAGEYHGRLNQDTGSVDNG